MNTKNIWLISGVLIAILLFGFFLLRKPSVPETSQMPVPGAEGVEEMVVTEEEVREVEVSGDEYSYSPSLISVKKGERIRIIFTNNGNMPHNLVIEDLGVSTRTIGFGQTDTVEFTAEGDVDIEFYCSILNHKALGMEGTLKVE